MNTKSRTLIYLASPYYAKDPDKRNQRALAVARAGGVFIARGWPMFVPVAHGHAMATACADMPEAATLEKDHNLWDEVSDRMLAHSKAMIVLTLGGFDRSRGVRREVEYMDHRGLPVRLFHYHDAERIPQYNAADPFAGFLFHAPSESTFLTPA